MGLGAWIYPVCIYCQRAYKQLSVLGSVSYTASGFKKTIKMLAEGKFADFVVVDGDPVADISVMYKIPEHVIKDGKIIR